MGWPDSASAVVGAGVRRMATASVRSSPHTKHVGNGWSLAPGYWGARVVAWCASMAGMAGFCHPGAAGVAVATVFPVTWWRIVAVLLLMSVGSGTSSGGGWRRATVIAAFGLRCAASAPAVQPPFPEERGPLRSAGIVTVFIGSSLSWAGVSCCRRFWLGSCRAATGVCGGVLCEDGWGLSLFRWWDGVGLFHTRTARLR